MNGHKTNKFAVRILVAVLLTSFLISACAVFASLVPVNADNTATGNETLGEQPIALIAINAKHLNALKTIMASKTALDEYNAKGQSVDLLVGKTLSCVFTYGNGYAEVSNVTWRSSDTAVATVDSTGQITARKAGTAVITAERDGISTSIAVIVSERFSLNCQSLNVTVGQMSTVKTNMTGTLNDYIYQVDWSGIDSGGKMVVVAGGLFQTQYSGTGSVTATVKMDNKTVASLECKFMSLPMAIKLDIDYKNRYSSIEKESNTSLTCAILPVNAEQTVRWESSNPDIATIDANGRITVLNDGTVTFTAYAQCWNGTEYADVVVSSDGKTYKNISDSITTECWIQANRHYLIHTTKPERCDCDVPVNAKSGETVRITTTREVTVIENGWEYCSVVGVYPYDSNNNPIASTKDPLDPTTFAFVMPDSEVTMNVVSATTHRVTYANNYKANFVRDDNLVGYLKIDEPIEGSFVGTYHVKIGDPAVTVRLGNVMCIGGDATINDDGTATIVFGQDSIGEDKEIYFYADSQDINAGTYLMYVTGDATLTIPNMVHVVNNGCVLPSDTLLSMSEASKTAYGETLVANVNDALLIYGTTYAYICDNNLSLEIHFKDGLLKIPYTAIKATQTADNDYVRISFAKTSSGSNNDTIGAYALDIVKGTGEGEETDIKTLMADCELQIPYTGSESKLNMKTRTTTVRLKKNGSVLTAKLTSLGLVGADGFEVTVVESPVKLGDILFYGCIALLLGGLGVAAYFLYKRYKALKLANQIKADEAKETVVEEAVPEDADTVPYSEATMKSVDSLLVEAGLADEAEKIRQNNLAELRRVQDKGKAQVVLANREIEPLMHAATTDADLNHVTTEDGEVRKFLDEGDALIGLSADVMAKCEIDPQTIDNEELITFTDALRDGITCLNTRTEKYREAYQALSEWILEEKARKEREALEALNKLLDSCDACLAIANRHKENNDRVLNNIASIRPTMSRVVGFDKSEADAFEDNLAILDINTETAYRKEENLAQEIAGVTTFVELARRLGMSEGVAEREAELRNAMNEADAAVHDADDSFRNCSQIQNRIMVAIQARENMEKTGLIAQIVAYVGISDNVIAEREERLKTVKANCLDVNNDVPDAIINLYSEASARLETMKGDIAVARDVTYDKADNYTKDVLSTMSEHLKADFDYNGTSDLYNMAQEFISNKRHGEYTDAMAAFEAENQKLSAENRELLTSHSSMLEAALAGLSVREAGDADASPETIAALEAVLDRENKEYLPNMNALTECHAADAEAQQYVDTLTAYTERIHQNAAQIRAFDYHTAGDKQLASITQMLKDDLDMVKAARHVITENATGLDPKRLSRKKLKYWQNQTNNSNQFIREYAKKKLNQHRDGVAVTQQMRKLSKDEYRKVLQEAASEINDEQAED